MNLEDYSLSELRELAKNKNIKGYSKYKKSELIDLLTENDTTNNEDKNNESVVTDSNTTYKITNSDDKIAEGILEKGVLGVYMPEFDLNCNLDDYFKSKEWIQIIQKWEGYVRKVVDNKGKPPMLY